MEELNLQEMEFVAGESWQWHAKNMMGVMCSGGGFGFAVGGPVGAAFGIGYAVMGYGIAVLYDNSKYSKRR